jgi:hypothetical protein
LGREPAAAVSTGVPGAGIEVVSTGAVLMVSVVVSTEVESDELLYGFSSVAFLHANNVHAIMMTNINLNVAVLFIICEFKVESQTYNSADFIIYIIHFVFCIISTFDFFNTL